jgi:hypothetical protein
VLTRSCLVSCSRFVRLIGSIWPLRTVRPGFGQPHACALQTGRCEMSGHDSWGEDGACDLRVGYKLVDAQPKP